MSEEISLRISLLDAQIVDCDRLPIGRVDDIELERSADGDLVVTALLTGSEALGSRIGGITGGLIAAASRRLRASAEERPPRIDAALIDELEPLLRLRVAFDELEDVAGLERWLAANLVSRLPGSGDAGQ